MSGLPPNQTRKYSAGNLAVGAVFCPACNHRVRDRDALVCPACSFKGEDTMRLFPFAAPPLEVISDHAKLFSARDRATILRAIHRSQRGFPQIHWRVVTVDLKKEDDLGLFAFWLLNVSPPGKTETLGLRPWTILLVVDRKGEVAAASGYAAEIWLSGHDWGRLLNGLHANIQQGKYGYAFRKLINRGDGFLQQAWVQIVERIRNSPGFVLSRKS